MNKNDAVIVRWVLRVAALATFIIGILLILLPGKLIRLVEDNPNPPEHFAVYLGTALIGFSITNWLYGRYKDIDAVLPAIYGNVTSLTIGALIDLVAVIEDKANIFLWLILVMHMSFAAAFAYCILIIKKRHSPAPM